MTPQSHLTRERPDLWGSGIALAERTTGLKFRDKLPLADGTIYACGYYNPQPILPQLPPRLPKIRNPSHVPGRREPTPAHIKPDTFEVKVPDGAMEWLLHEVGHWVAATPEERQLPNYGLTDKTFGHDGDREWQAWAFEEIVMAPFGHARQFAPPTQRDGTAFEKSGPMPQWALRHVESQIRDLGLDIEPFRMVWGDWVHWGRAKATLPWDSDR